MVFARQHRAIDSCSACQTSKNDMSAFEVPGSRLRWADMRGRPRNLAVSTPVQRNSTVTSTSFLCPLTLIAHVRREKSVVLTALYKPLLSCNCTFFPSDQQHLGNRSGSAKSVWPSLKQDVRIISFHPMPQPRLGRGRDSMLAACCIDAKRRASRRDDAFVTATRAKASLGKIEARALRSAGKATDERW